MACLLPALATSVHAEITYLQLQSDGTHRLRQMNVDGSADVAIQLPFADMQYPTWSADRRQLAITAVDPATPRQKSSNVFAISAANGAITKLTRYEDVFDEANSSLSYAFPLHKAFSPDRSKLATFSILAFGGGGMGVTTFPTLEIHSLTMLTNALLLGNDDTGGGMFHGGEGVDWAPDRPVLAVPRQTTAPQPSGGTGGVTAIFLAEPSEGALLFNRTQQVTFPRAGANVGTGDADTYIYGEHDYQPKFSPNGIALAYVRSFQVMTLLDLTNPTPNTQSIRIRNLNTGAETEVISFRQGFYVTSISWSPDGQQLAFDIGVQATNGIGMLVQRARPETNQIYVVNVDGTGLRQLRGNGNSSPAFGPRINAGGQTQMETESLTLQARSGATHSIVRDAKLSQSAGTLVSNTTVGSSVTYTVPVPRAGTYNIKVRIKKGPTRGKFQLSIGQQKRGPVQDAYSPAVDYQVRNLGSITFPSGGNKAFKFTVTGKNANSSGTSLVFDWVKVTPQ